jgi:4-diphosphocytidyl-2-C-methyl-D-erythritol kinase
MATRVRSYSKINLGLAIGPVRPDGFHGLVTLYQTLALHDVVTVKAKRAGGGRTTRITITTNHPFVPTNERNTVWKMVEKVLGRLGIVAEVAIHIEKNLPVQGGMGAGSANAAAALIGLERELGMALPEAERLAVAAEVGSDVPLFLVGGAVLGTGRGEIVEAMPDLPATVCLIAVPGVGVSTPAAFREWDKRRQLGVGSSELVVESMQPAGSMPSVGEQVAGAITEAATFAPTVSEPEGEVISAGPGVEEAGSVIGVGLSVGLTQPPLPDTLKELSHAYASVFRREESGTSGIVPGNTPENLQSKSDLSDSDRTKPENDLAGNILLSLVRTGVENDFEQVVFSEYPSLREIKRILMGIDTATPALYAALSGSGSALFGLYKSTADAEAAQRRVQTAGLEFGVKTFLTETLPRPEYWARMFAG